MPTEETHSYNPEDHLDEIIADVLKAEENGETVDANDWIERYPRFAGELSDYFAERAAFGQIVEKIREEKPLDALTEGSPELLRVRYFGDYELRGEIARGGMGVVYRARQLSVNRPVALKMILAGHLASDEEVRRFRGEAELAANLDHPNIVPLYEVGEHDGQHYYSMKLIEGGSLKTRLTEYIGDGRKAAQLVAAAARAMHYAHQRGLLHRDLKPGNILIDKDGCPYVADFGLAKRYQRTDEQSSAQLTEKGAIVGTLEYMAREQAQGERSLTTAADVYSLGAILYTLLTGKPPFRGDNVAELLQQVIEKEPSRPRQSNSKPHVDLETICLKCLHKEAAKRYRSAEALADDLQRYLDGKPIEARRVGMGERMLKWARRHPAVSGLLAALVLVTVVGFGLVTWQWREAVWQREEAVRLAAEELKAKKEARENQQQAEQLLVRNEHLLYQKQIDGAYREWLAHNAVNANSLLHQCQHNLRGLEYDCLRHLFQGRGKILRGHQSTVTRVIVSPDGRWIASASHHTICLWDRRSGELCHVFANDSGFPPPLVFSPDINSLLAGSKKGEIRFWSVTTGKLIDKIMTGTESVIDISFVKNKDVLGATILRAQYPEKGIHQHLHKHATLVIDAKNRTVLKRIDFDDDRNNDWRMRLHAAADGFYLTKAHLQYKSERSSFGQCLKLSLHDWITKKEIHRLPIKWNSTAAPWVRRLSPDGRLYAFAGYDDITIWNLTKRKRTVEKRVMVPELGRYKGVLDIAFSPDGKKIATAGDDWMIKLWNADSMELLKVLKGHKAPVYSVAFTPDGRQLVSGSRDRTVRIWDLIDAESARLPLLSESYDFLDFSSNGQWLAIRRKGVITVIDVCSAAVTNSFSTDLTSGAFAISNDGKKVVTLNYLGRKRSAAVWDVSTGRMLRSQEKKIDGAAYLAISPDGKTLQIDNTIWDFLTWKPKFQIENQWNVEFSPTGRFFAGVDQHGMMNVWMTTTGKVQWSLPGFSGYAEAIAISPDEHMVAIGTSSGRIFIWDLRNEKLLHSVQYHRHMINALSFSPDSSRLVSCSTDGMITLMDTRSGNQLLSILEKHEVLNVRFAADGRALRAVLAGGRLKSWHAAAKKRYRYLANPFPEFMEGDHEADFAKFALSKDGRYLLSCKDLDTFSRLQKWDLHKGVAVQSQILPKRTAGVTFTKEGLAVARWLAFDERNGNATLREGISGRSLVSFRDHRGPWQLGLSDDGNYVAAVSPKRNSVVVNNIRTKTVIFRCDLRVGKNDYLGDTFLSPKHDLFGLILNDGLHLWKMASRKKILHRKNADTAAISSDGRLLAISEDVGRTIVLWDIKTRQCTSMYSPVIPISNKIVAFSPNNQTLLTFDGEGMFFLRDIKRPGRTIALLQTMSEATKRIGALFHPDGRRIICALNDGSIILWDVNWK